MLNNDKIIKKYKFDYGSRYKCILSTAFSFFINTIAMFTILILLLFLYLNIENYITDEMIHSFIDYVYIALSISVIICFNFQNFSKKRIILYNDYIFIKKRTILGSLFYLPQGIFNEKILYRDIIYCDYCDEKISAFNRKKDFSIEHFNEDSLILIKVKNGHKYYVPVLNCDDFIAEVNKIRQLGDGSLI